MTTTHKPKKAERQDFMLSELRASPIIRISELAHQLGVSTETIRRDLAELNAQGALSRTYGGAAARPFGLEPAITDRHKVFVAERERIASLAVEMLKPGEVLMIDSGATVFHFARRLSGDLHDLTVITNSFGVATILACNPTIRVLMCPGVYDGRERTVFGSDAERFLERFNANVAVISASGLTAEGPNDANPHAAAIKRAMLSRASSSMLLLDHSKFDLLALETICPLARIGCLVADAAPAAPLAGALRRAGVAVKIAPLTPDPSPAQEFARR